MASGGDLTSLRQSLRRYFQPPAPRPQASNGAAVDLDALAGLVVAQLQPQLVTMQQAFAAATTASLQTFQAQLLGQLQQLVGGNAPPRDGEFPPDEIFALSHIDFTCRPQHRRHVPRS